MAEQKDYYQILGITKSATLADIKKSYRKLALQYHPDRNKSKDAGEKFKEINKAYEVLADPQKKQAYDQFGASAFEQGSPFSGGQNPFGSAAGGQYGPFTYTYSGNGDGFNGFEDMGGFTDPFEIFEQFFGGAFPFGRRQRRPTYSITINFMEAVHGTAKKISIEGKEETIKIPAGVDEGSRIRFGNYEVIISVSPDPKFRREGNDIIGEKEISFSQAATGAEVNVETIDGNVKIRIPAGTQPESVIRLRGKGVQDVRGIGKGNHYVRIKIFVPRGLSARQKELLKEFDIESKKKHGWF